MIRLTLITTFLLYCTISNLQAQCQDNLEFAVRSNLVRSQDDFVNDFTFFACIALEMHTNLGNERYLQTSYKGGFLVGRFHNNVILSDADLAIQLDRIENILVELSVYRDNAIAGTMPISRTFSSYWYDKLSLLKKFLEMVNGYVSESTRVGQSTIKRVGKAARDFFNDF